MPDAIFGLAFSARGHFLAAVGGGWGLRVWNAATGEELARDPDYHNEDTAAVDWHQEEQLATGSHDGTIQLYQMADALWPGLGSHQVAAVQPNFNKTADGSSKPICAVRFSPAGDRLAIGYTESTRINVVDGKDLNYLFSPDASGIGNGDVGSVAWSDDGSLLAAGGKWNVKGRTPIRVWSRAGRGSFQDTFVAEDTVLDVRPLPSQRFVFSSGDPGWGTLAADRQVNYHPPASSSDYWNRRGNFHLSKDGSDIVFEPNEASKGRLHFSIPERVLELNEEKMFAMSGGRTEPAVQGVNSFPTAPSGDMLLPILYRSEEMLVLTKASDASFFLLGTNFLLRSYAPEGAKNWEVPAPSRVCALNLAQDNRVAAAAFGDGTIHWYRTSDGRELLALFAHADKKRWVLWTPEGYYDASPGAEDLIGWHVNRGKEQAADFFPVTRFRALYYRPDVIQRVLKTLDVNEALRQANTALGRPGGKPEGIREVLARLSPPVVELATGGVFGTVDIPRSARSTPVRYRVRQTGEEAPTKVSVRFNGRPVAMDAPLPHGEQEATADVPLPEGAEGEVSIIAEHRFGASEAASLRVRRQGGAAPVRKPDLYLIACGIDHYQANETGSQQAAAPGMNRNTAIPEPAGISFPDLAFAGSDARRFAGLFASQAGSAFEHLFPTLLLDRQATTGGIEAALENTGRQAQPGDVVIVFFANHGHFVPEPGFLLITHDTDPRNLAATALSGQEMARRLAGIRGSIVLALDTCHSGAVLAGEQTARAVTGPGDLAGLVNQLSGSEQGVVVLSSSAENEYSIEDDHDKQGVFTKAVAEGFAGGAVKERRITCASLQEWVAKRVPELVKGLGAAVKQTPVCIMPKDVPDFVLAKP